MTTTTTTTTLRPSFDGCARTNQSFDDDDFRRTTVSSTTTPEVRSFVRSFDRAIPFPWVGGHRTDGSIDRSIASREVRFGSVRFGSVRFATTTTSAYVPREGWWFEQSWRTCCRRSFPCVFMSSSFPTTRRTNRTSSRTGTGIGIGINQPSPGILTRRQSTRSIDPLILTRIDIDIDSETAGRRGTGTAPLGYGM